jgi:hypothetical protein
MTLEQITGLIKTTFEDINKAFYKGDLSIQYIEDKLRVYAEASPMFGVPIVKYGEANFEYFFELHRYLATRLDIVKLTVDRPEIPKLKISGDLLSIAFAKQASQDTGEIANEKQLVQLNQAAHLFSFFHELGHVNQESPEDRGDAEANHFAEYNADYYAISQILKYHHRLKASKPVDYYKNAVEFHGELNMIRSWLASALMTVYLEFLSDENPKFSVSHPESKKRFCYLMHIILDQLAANFSDLFVSFKVEDFVADIFVTMDFLEAESLDKPKLSFPDLLDFCTDFHSEMDQAMQEHKKFTTFNE